MSRPQVVVTKCKTAGRCGTGAVKAIVLHGITSDIDSIVAEARQCCDRGCQASLHYYVDNVSCKVWQMVPEADTAWGFAFTPPTTNICNPCVSPTEYCDPCALPITDPIFAGESGDLTLIDPNCFVIHVGIVLPIAQVPGKPVPTDPCASGDLESCPEANKLSPCAYQTLVSLLCDIFSRYPALPKTAATIRKFGCNLPEIDIIQLIADVQQCPAPPVPFNRLCSDLKQFPVGAPATVFGVDAAGQCVQGTIGSGGGIETPITVSQSPTVTLGASGAANHTLIANVNVSAVTGNAIIIQPDGLFVPSVEQIICGLTDPLATPTISAAAVAQPNSYYGENNLFNLYTPYAFMRIPCASSPSGFFFVPMYR